MLEKLKDRVEEIYREAESQLKEVSDLDSLNRVKSNFVGKKGKITLLLKEMKQLSKDEKPEFGKIVNKAKSDFLSLWEKKKIELVSKMKRESISRSSIDVSLPGRGVWEYGGIHPVSLVIDEVVQIFRSMGFTPVEGPELEEEYYNFDALNIPVYHPARDEQDSFYITDSLLLRTQTSPVQVRTMLSHKPPIAVVSPGRCFRRDAVDATHSHTFHQIEGLLVDKDVSFSDLKGTLLVFAKKFFGEDTRIRLRPDYFPFTEPSAEVAVSCPVCGGKGCRVCSYTGWLEIAGCGMVHPQVFKSVGYSSGEYSGFAFGMGIERLAMVKYGVSDIRLFFENDKRFLLSF